MKNLSNPLARTNRARRERGASLIEYVLIAALVALAAITGLTTLGTTIGEKLDEVKSGISGTAN